MFLTGKATYPVERTLLTTGLVEAGVDSLFQNQQRIETPHLEVSYQPTPESTYWDADLTPQPPLHSGEGATAHSIASSRKEGPKRIAVIASVYHYRSHAQHFSDRFLVGYPVGGRWHRPDMQIVSLYVDQRPVDDQSTDRAREFGFAVYPTIAEALRCGGDKLAVDAVLLMIEHGDYPRNEKGQILYPRYEFFKAVCESLRGRRARCPDLQ